MLKKVICLLLVLTCSAVLFACAGVGTANTDSPEGNGSQSVNNNPSAGGSSESSSADKDFVNDKTEVDLAREQSFFTAVNNSQPNLIVTLTNITHSKLGTCVGYYKTTILGEDNYSFYYEYETFNKVGEGAKPKESVGPHTIYYSVGRYSLDNETWVYDHPDSNVMNVKLDLNKKNLGDYVISADATQLVTKVSAADAEKILGVKISATSKVEITVKTDGTHLWNIAVDYTNDQTKTHIETSYTYENALN